MLKEFKKDKLDVKIMATRSDMGKIAGTQTAERLKSLLAEKDSVNMIFAAAPSQNEMLDTLVNFKEIDWSRVNAFHMDEYIGLPLQASQGFGNFLKERLFSKLNFKNVYCINGQAKDLAAECERYSALLKEYPVDIVCMGIGENGHIAFNDPWVAEFDDEKAVKVVRLDEVCRHQQVNDGCFKYISEVPSQALTLTIPTLTAAKYIFCTVPASTKRAAVNSVVNGAIITDCPASILRTHNNAVLYCDNESGADLI